MDVISEKQKEFIKNGNHRYNIKIGARRCGKTYLDSLYLIPKRIRDRHGLDGLNVILGVSKGTIERNVLQPMRQIYGNKLVSTINSANIAHLFGEEVYCLGAEKVNQVSKIQGTSIKYCYCDELAKFNPEVFEMLKGSLDKPYSMLDGALNPENMNHWLKKDFIDTIEEKGLDVYLQHYTIFDNPYLSKEFVDNLCKEYEGSVYYNRLILGQWCNAEGIIFRSIADNKERYIIDRDKIGSGIISIGVDFGGNKSAHAFVASLLDRNFKDIKVLKSRRVDAKGSDSIQLCNELIKFIREIIDEHGMPHVIFCDSAEQVLIETIRGELRKKGLRIPVEDSIKTPLNDRIEAISRLLLTDRMLFRRYECDSVITALQTALYDDDAKGPGDRWLDDGTSDIDSLDALTYSIEKWFNNYVRRNT